MSIQDKIQEKFIQIGDKERIVSSLVDLAKICHFNEIVSFSFYQVDYLSFVNSVVKKEEDQNIVMIDNLIPVVKVAMPIRGFLNLHQEINLMFEKLVEIGLVAEPGEGELDGK